VSKKLEGHMGYDTEHEAKMDAEEPVMKLNAVFRYMYRDGGNNKENGYVVFKLTTDSDLEAITEKLKKHLDEDDYFIAEQVRIPSIAFYATGKYKLTDLDHCWHEFDGTGLVPSEPDDPLNRSFEEFIEEFILQSVAGWNEFSPEERYG